MRSSVRIMIAALLLFTAGSASAQIADLVRTPVNPANRMSLTGHHPSWANPQNDVGTVPADLPLERLTLVLARSPQREQAYTKFLQDQQNPASPDYHHWLTPVEIGKRFGASAHDIHAVTVWLQSQNLHVDSVANSRERIIFSGPASAIASAFGAELHYFMVSGEKRISITAEPQIPVAMGQVVKSISGLYTVKYYPQNKSTVVPAPLHNQGSNGQGIVGEGSFNGVNFIFPADFATIYNINGVTGGINGAGQSIAIVGRSRVCTQDITNFATLSGVTINLNPPNGIVPPLGVDPGAAQCTAVQNPNPDQGEATLDVTRSGSIAQGANVALVVSLPTQTEDGIQIAAQYVVDTVPVPAHIMSISFGGCENQQGGQSEVQFWDALFQTAAGEGISVFVSSGDSGAAGCDPAFKTPPTSQVLSPNAICASSYTTCVGGTEFADFANPTQYWGTNSIFFGSALSYIPEGAWNEPMNGSAFQVAGTGGGVSGFIATPAYQTGTGVPAARTGRYTPDVAFSASAHDGYFACLADAGATCVSNGPFEVFAGTSASAPDMAGIAALLNQKEGSAQGLLNPKLYQLGGTSVFNDVTVVSSGVTGCAVTTPSMCNNSTPGPTSLTGGLSGYLVGTGYDEATGLGSINVANLLANWSSSSSVGTTTVLTIAPPSPVTFGTSVTLTATVTPASGTSAPTGTVAFSDAVLGHVGTGKLNNLGVATFTSTTLVGASYSITATYTPTGAFLGSTSSASPYNVQDFTIAASPTTVAVSAPGQSGTTTLTITPLGGFNQTITYTCTGLPSEATCAFAAASATTETVTITTTAPSARMDKAPLGRSRGLFYALLLPGFLGLVLSAGNRKRSLHSVRLLGLITVLAIFTLCMPACGGGSSKTPSNPGTPTGTSTVTVTATAGTLQPKNVAITLTVQ